MSSATPPNVDNGQIFRNITVTSCIVLIIIGLFLTVPLLRNRKQSEKQKERLQTIVETSIQASSMLENLEIDDAIEQYESLLKANPNEPALLNNLAIANVKRIEQVIARLKNPDYQDEHPVLESQLPSHFESAKTAAAKAIEMAPSNATGYVMLFKIADLEVQRNARAHVDIYSRVFERLDAAIESGVTSPQLVYAYNQAVESLSLTRPELVEKAIEPLWAAWQANPNNLVILRSLAQRLDASGDSRIKEVIRAAKEISQPFKFEIELELGEDSDAFLDESLEDPEPGILFSPWLNTLGHTTAYASDNKLAAPDTLAFVDFSNINQALEELAAIEKENAPSPPIPEVQFENLSVLGLDPSQTEMWKAIACSDLDSDLYPDLIALGQNEISVYRGTSELNGLWTEPLGQATLSHPANHIHIADLFLVDQAGRPRIPTDDRSQSSNPSADEEQREKNQSDADENARPSKRHDTFRDLIVYGDAGVEIFAWQADASGKLQLVNATKDTGLADLTSVSTLRSFDLEADGDLDLAIVSNGSLQIFRNLGNRVFQNITGLSLPESDQYSIVTLEVADIDRDIDLDLLCTTEQGELLQVENLLHGQFRFTSLSKRWPTIAANQISKANSLRVLELDGNVSWDIIVAGSGGGVSILTTTPSIGETRATLARDIQLMGSSFVYGDFNNDGQTDIISADGDQGVQISSWSRSGEFSSAVRIAEELRISQLASADIDLDGRPDIVGVGSSGLRILRNTSGGGGEPSNFLDLRVQGMDDNSGGGRVNHYGYGTTIEVFSDNQYQSAIVRDVQTHFGLGSDQSAYNVRLIFPMGVTQNIVNPPGSALLEEKQFPKGSCPFLYGWDGHRWQFVTDLLWNAPLGLQVAPGVVVPDRRWEYLSIPSSLMHSKDGQLEIRITEELWEAAYFDQIQLFAIDLPKSYEGYSNEKVGPPDISQPGIWKFSNIRPVPKIADQANRSWVQELSETDQSYAVPFREHVCQGVVEPYRLAGTVPIDDSDHLQFVLNGWIYPSDTSLNIKLSQNSSQPAASPPSLWLRNQNGEYECVMPFMGFPGGKPKNIVVDVTPYLAERFRLNKEIQFEIRGSTEIYWDSISFSTDGILAPIESMPIELTTAELRHNGFAQIHIPIDRSQPHHFDYSRRDPRRQWPPMSGRFTRYGDIADLLYEDDDRMVVIGAGDEMQLRFRNPSPVKEGFERHWLLKSVGWDKDADLNTLDGQSSFPLPFQSMSQYPPMQREMQRAAEVMKLNADHLTRTQDANDFWRKSMASESEDETLRASN